ncbi:MAG: BrnA antitoxin family protein [Patescibacteria group bacterium]
MKKNKQMIKSIPHFKSEDDERDFWATHDATDYFDFSKPMKLDISELKFSTFPVTIRLPQSLVDDLKIQANRRDVPYQSLMKIFLAEKVREEELMWKKLQN